MAKQRDIFEALARKARSTRDPFDVRQALRYGIEHRISLTNIRKKLY